MILFSKRNPRLAYYRTRFSTPSNLSSRHDLFLDKPLRIRLKKALQDIVSLGQDYLEPFLVFVNEKRPQNYFQEEELRNLFQREVGYNILHIFDPINLDFYAERDNATEKQKVEYMDSALFDLLEMILIFAKNDKRDEIRERIQLIFKEEDRGYIVHDYMIFSRESTGLSALYPLLKNETLKTKLKEFYESRRVLSSSHEALASISADIIQHLFSSPEKKKQTKTYSEDLCRRIASKWTTKENTNNLAKLLNETVINSKNLNNQISNIRHTDQTTIPVDTPALYKVITNTNISLAELVILSFPEDYIVNQNTEKIKKEYLSRYKIDNRIAFIGKDEIDPSEIPF